MDRLFALIDKQDQCTEILVLHIIGNGQIKNIQTLEENKQKLTCSLVLHQKPLVRAVEIVESKNCLWIGKVSMFVIFQCNEGRSCVGADNKNKNPVLRRQTKTFTEF